MTIALISVLTNVLIWAIFKKEKKTTYAYTLENERKG